MDVTMSYSYQIERPFVFTERGVKAVMESRTIIERCLAISGAVTMGVAMDNSAGNSWSMMAVVDYLLEIGFIREVEQLHEPAGQHRIFMPGKGSA
jgi:hypothetical protein